MTVPVINKFLGVFTEFRWYRNYFGFTLKTKSEEIYGMFFAFLTSGTSWFSTRTAGQREAAFHHINREIFEDLFFSHWYGHINLLTV
jgi:hypothetical protein